MKLFNKKLYTPKPGDTLKIVNFDSDMRNEWLDTAMYGFLVLGLLCKGASMYFDARDTKYIFTEPGSEAGDAVKKLWDGGWSVTDGIGK